MNESAFFQDLALLMAVAGLVSVVFAKLRWPKVIGYIFAGVMMSQYTWGGGFLADEASVRTIGQLGVVFLMFAMGLDFSPSQMKRIKNVALPTAIVDTVVMTWLGYTIGRHCFGWGSVPSLFLGAAICDSATTMLAKVIGEMKWSSRPFVKYALGTSVCEDIICVGVISLITGVATGGGVSLSAAGLSLGGLCVFFLSVIVFGFVFVPRLLKSVAKTHDGEALLLTMLGCCFFISWVAFKFDFSLALGAFLVGILGGSSDEHRRLEELVDPLKSMFAAVFFVSIGLLLDPAACWRFLPQILLVSGAVVVGKFLNCSFGALATGESVKTAVQMGLSLAQIGEFAFMVAILYFTITGDTSNPIYTIVVASSVLTTLLNPFLIRASVPAGEWVEAHLPGRFRAWNEAYRGLIAKYHQGGGEVRLHHVVRLCFSQIGVLLALNFAVAVVCMILDGYDWSKFSAFFNAHKRFVFSLTVNLFIVERAVPAVKIAQRLAAAVSDALVGEGAATWQLATRHLVSLIVLVAVVILFFAEMAMINVHLSPESVWARWVIRAILFIAAVFGWRFFLTAGQRAARRFDEALTADERREKLGAMLTLSVPAEAVHKLTLTADSPAIGASVVTLDIRAKTGASVVAVTRDGDTIRNVGPETEFRIGDTLTVLGECAQVAALKDLLGITA
jgi:CPA2 family monovalent cation:H+ antiporter-2